MATIVHQLTRSAVRQARQPKWTQLLQKSYKNLHFQAIYQQKRFRQRRPSDGDDQEKKFCIDYKKDPTVEGHEPPNLPELQPANPKLRIQKRRKFLQDKKCKELEKEVGNDPCDNLSRVSFIWGRPKLTISWHKINSCLMRLSKPRSLDPDPVYLNQERTFCQKKRKPSPSKPVPPRSERIARKRKHLKAKQKKEAEAKAKLIHACNSNSQTKRDLKIVQSNNELAAEKELQDEISIKQAELKPLLKLVKERCRKKCEAFEKSREVARQKAAEEAYRRNQNKISEIKRLCQEARKFNAFRMANRQRLSAEAHLRKQDCVAKLTIKEKERDGAPNFKKDV